MAAKAGDVSFYFQDAETWHTETYRKVKASRARAWWLAFVAMGLATACTLTLALVVPRQHIELVPVLVNSVSGEVHVMQSLRDPTLSGNEAVRKADLAGYVVARESYDPNRTLLAIWYETVRSRSAQAPFDRYATSFQGPDSIFCPRLWAEATRDISIKSVVLLDHSTGQVRYGVTERSESESTRSDWIATITFDYDSQPAPLEQRLKNPLGFEVTAYRSDPETLPERRSPMTATCHLRLGSTALACAGAGRHFGPCRFAAIRASS